MDDAVRAERALEKAWEPRHREEFRGLTIDGLLDVSFVSLLKAASGTFALREAIAGTSNSLLNAQERANKYKGRLAEAAERYDRKLGEAKAREDELWGRMVEAENDRDAWQHKHQEAESRELITRAQLKAAEAKLAVVGGSLEEARGMIEELTRQLQEADDRADKAAHDALAAGKRAEDAEVRMEWEMAAAARQAREAEAKAAAADERAREAEARAAVANERAESRENNLIQNFLLSEEFKLEMAEAATDAYIRGFELCKKRVAAAYKLEGLDAIQPSPTDDDGDDEEGADKDPKAADK